MEFTLTTNQGFPVEKFSVQQNIFIPTVLFIRDQDIGALYYFKASDVEGKRDVDIFLRTYNARKRGGVITLYATSKSFVEYRFIGDLIKIPSVVMNYVYVSGGRHFFNYRFHSSSLKEVSNLLLSENKPSSVQVESISMSRGLKQSLETFHKNAGLSVVVARSIPPKEEFTEDKNPMGSNWSREVKANDSEGRIRGVYYGAKEIKAEDVLKISDGIYEADTDNPVLKYLSSKQDELIIPAISRFQTLINEDFTLVEVLPSLYKDDYIEMLSKASRLFPEWHLTLTEVESLDNTTAL
jgi:AAA+ ATPase superfamily predicted ATPase